MLDRKALNNEDLYSVSGGAQIAALTKIVYRCKKGDTIKILAQKFGTKVEALLEANDISDENEVLEEGRKIIIC